MIIDRYLITTLGLNIRFSENIIIGGDGPFKGCSAPMLDVSTYEFKLLTEKKVKPEESFINAYVDECLDSEGTISSTRRIHIILDAKYKKADLKQVMDKKCQHLIPNEREILLHLLRKFKSLFYGTLGTRKTTPVDLELKDDATSVCSRSYPVPRVHEEMFRKEFKRLVKLGVLEE